jgi:tryptophan-rich sensory protein
MTENIPRKSRGRLYGLRTFALGVGGLAMGIVTSRLLSRIDAPRNYQVSFLIGDVLLLFSCLLLLFFRDEAAVDDREASHTLYVSLKQKLKNLLDEPNYRIFLLFHLLNVVAVNLAAFIVPCFAVAGLGGLATGHSVETWYKDLAKPSWTPPGWVFGPVWTLLYMAMAIAAWRVWQGQGLRWPLALVGAQLLFNAAWSWLFFGLRMPGIAFFEILMLWFAILYTIANFYRVSKTAAYLLIPYIIWVSFAGCLNFMIWRMN